MKNNVRLFEEKKVRTVWDDKQEKWYFSIIDVVGILTDQPTRQRAGNYWKVLKNRLLTEGNQTVTNCNRLKLLAEDGKIGLRVPPYLGAITHVFLDVCYDKEIGCLLIFRCIRNHQSSAENCARREIACRYIQKKCKG